MIIIITPQSLCSTFNGFKANTASYACFTPTLSILNRVNKKRCVVLTAHCQKNYVCEAIQTMVRMLIYLKLRLFHLSFKENGYTCKRGNSFTVFLFLPCQYGFPLAGRNLLLRSQVLFLE